MSAAPIHQEVTFQAPADRIYNALTDSAQFSAFTGVEGSSLGNEAGGPVSCFGGYVTGRIIELVPNKRIVQAWRAANWEEGVYSIIKFELEGNGSETKLIFDQAGFPDGTGEHLAEGWHSRYWEPLATYLG